MNILLSPWRGGTPRRLCKVLDLKLRGPEEIEQFLAKRIYFHDIIVNWGCTKVLTRGVKMLNYPSRVAVAADKLACLKALTEAKISCLEFTTDIAKACDWHYKHSVIAHFDLHGHSANGLVLYKKGEGDMTVRKDLKLFTKYFPKKIESRVLCVADETQTKYKTMYMEKKRQTDKEKLEEKGIEDSPQTYIRTWDNGWIFARDVLPDIGAVDLAGRTMAALKLTYGAVDILKDSKGEYRVGEVNTAPGLEGQALNFFSSQIRRLIMLGVYNR